MDDADRKGVECKGIIEVFVQVAFFSCFAISRLAKKKMHDHISYAISDTNWNILEDIFQRICAY